MKRRYPHLVFLSRQALDIFIALKTFAGGSAYVLPIAKHHFFMAQWMASTTPDAMFGARYHASAKGRSMVSICLNALILKDFFAISAGVAIMVFKVENCEGHADRYQAAKPQAN